MNIVLVEGGKAKERELVEQVACWCVNKLMPRFKTLDIEITIKKINTSAYGYCLEGDTNRQFHLDIKKGLSLYDLVSTVCHEMVHVKQYVKGQLLHRSDGSQMWKMDPSIREGKTKYENTPWEVEAFGLEDELAKECFQQINFNF